MEYIRLPISDYPGASLEALVGSVIVPMAEVGDFYQCEFPNVPSGTYIIQVRDVGTTEWDAIAEVYWSGFHVSDLQPSLEAMMVRDFVFACRHSGEAITYIKQDGTSKSFKAMVTRGEPAELAQANGVTDDTVTIAIPRDAEYGVPLVTLRGDKVQVAPRYGAVVKEYIVTAVTTSDEASVTIRVK